MALTVGGFPTELREQIVLLVSQGPGGRGLRVTCKLLRRDFETFTPRLTLGGNDVDPGRRPETRTYHFYLNTRYDEMPWYPQHPEALNALLLKLVAHVSAAGEPHVRTLCLQPFVVWMKLDEVLQAGGTKLASSLETLILTGRTDVEDLTPLSALTALQHLDLGYCYFIDSLEPLSRLTNLRHLDLLHDPFARDLTPLGLLTGLHHLNLGQCNVQDLTCLAPLSMCTAFKDLLLTANRYIHDLALLPPLPALQHLCLRKCKSLHDISALAAYETLQNLDLGSCRAVDDVSVLAMLTNLQRLSLRKLSGLNDLTPLAALVQLQHLSLEQCLSVVDIGPLAACTALHTLDLAQTGVEDLGPLTACTTLQTLDVAETGVQDLEPLGSWAGLKIHIKGCTQLQGLDFHHFAPSFIYIKV